MGAGPPRADAARPDRPGAGHRGPPRGPAPRLGGWPRRALRVNYVAVHGRGARDVHPDGRDPEGSGARRLLADLACRPR